MRNFRNVVAILAVSLFASTLTACNGTRTVVKASDAETQVVASNGTTTTVKKTSNAKSEPTEVDGVRLSEWGQDSDTMMEKQWAEEHVRDAHGRTAVKQVQFGIVKAYAKNLKNGDNLPSDGAKLRDEISNISAARVLVTRKPQIP